MKFLTKSVFVAVLVAAFVAHPICPAFSADTWTLQNEQLIARLNNAGLTSIEDLKNQSVIHFKNDGVAIKINGMVINTSNLTPMVAETKETVSYEYKSEGWIVRVVYELEPGWGFVSKQILVKPESDAVAGYRVNNVELFRGEFSDRLSTETKSAKFRGTTRWGVFLRTADEESSSYGVLLLVQNPFMQWSFKDRQASLGYAPEVNWKKEYGEFQTDRACFVPYRLTGVEVVKHAIPEWKFVTEPEKAIGEAEKLDVAEIDAYQACVAAFMQFHPKKSNRIDVGWCENDYQIDCGTAEGRTEYKRIIDRAADLGCQYILYAPANNLVSKQEESRDAWGWESLLWLGLGQKIRKGEWDPAKDDVPAFIQEMLEYSRAKGIKLVAYAYPSLPWMQDREWTAWCNNDPGGYIQVDTGMRSFQDFFLKKLLDFQTKTGLGGYAFDHWWIAYDSMKDAPVSVSSKYAQWKGCQRILSELRKSAPDILIDGRQQYQGFGPWTWLGGTYPHPFGGDEQPGSFRARADLHTDRLSANHVRWVNWRYRMEDFCPPEMIPGYMTHQTQRSDDKGVMHRDPWRRADWDYLGWKYSVISSLATAPYNHVLNFIPARDLNEFKSFSKADQQWWKKWLDWTDNNLEILRNMRFIAAPMVGRTDGTSAFKGDRGFVFLFNANYSKMNADFTLDKMIGLAEGKRFIIEQLYPRDGLLIGKPNAGSWDYGDKVSLPMDGTSAVVLSVRPASQLMPLTIFNSTGKAAFSEGKLALREVSGEVGTRSQVIIAIPAGDTVKTASVNGSLVTFVQHGDLVSLDVKFAGVPFSQCQEIGKPEIYAVGSAFKADFTIPKRIFQQLKARKAAWPVPYTEDDLIAPWIGPDRLLLFVNIAEADPKMEVKITIDGKPVDVKKAFNGIYPNSGDQTFIGFYTDVAYLEADLKHRIEVSLPSILAPGQFQGVFFDNVEPDFTFTIAE